MPEAFVAGLAALGAGLAVGFTGVGAGLGEAGIGAVATEKNSEDRGFLGLSLLFTVIPETIVIFGLVISFILMFAY
ncbi:MAG: ATPase [Archaeoglobaceae archaeon]